MKKFIYVLIAVAGLASIQGCFWHSSRTVVEDREVPASSTSTTVDNPSGTTTTTTTP